MLQQAGTEKQQPLLEMTEQSPMARQTQHQRLPQCIVDFRVVNQPAPHEENKNGVLQGNTPF
jgi:hypothetical protein